MKGSESVFEYVQLLYYKCQILIVVDHIKISWLDKKQKATINSIHIKDNKCLQYSVTVELNQQKIKKDPQRITKIKPFIIKYYLEGINFPSEKDDWENCEKNNVKIAFDVLCVKKENIYAAYVSKNNSNGNKQLTLLMISNGEKLYYIAVKNFLAFLRRITSKNDVDF